MVEQKKKQYKSNYYEKGAPVEGLVRLPTGPGQIASKFIEPAKTFPEALANTRIEDPEFLRNIVILDSKMERFNENHLFDKEIESLTNLLVGTRSINGIGMNLAAMTDVDIYFPQGGGMAGMNESSKKHLQDINRIKAAQRAKAVDELHQESD